MPGKRITDLTALSGANSANNDDLVIFDATASETKRISRSQLAEGMQADVQVLSNKTMTLGSNTITGTTAQFNTALTDNNFATQAGSEVLTNKTINARTNTLQGSDGSRLHWFKDVAALLADTTLVAATGDAVRTQEEGFSYRVAASGASDQHVTTAGGVKLYVQRDLAGYNVKAFGAKGDGVTNDTTSIQSAIDAANAILVQAAGGGVSNVDFPQISGVEIYIPQGSYVITFLTTYENITLRGAGIYSTRLMSSYDGRVLSNSVTSGSYDKTGINFRDFSIKGDRTKTNQCLIDLLRPYWSATENVQVYQSGGVGIRVRQGLGYELHGVVAHANVGDGIVITDGIVSWADTTPNNLPSNVMSAINCHGSFNDGAGIRLTGAGAASHVNGCKISGGAYEYNYLAAGNNAGYQIHISCNTDNENVFSDVWVEGPAEAHVYINSGNIAVATKFVRLHHFGNGAAGNVDRALIVDRGTAILHETYGHGEQYKTISGSKAPFRLNKASSNAIIYSWFSRGSTITDNNFIEDETGAVSGLTNFAFQDNYGQSYGNTRHYGGFGQIIHGYYQEGQTQPFVTVVPGFGVGFGSGTASADAYISRTEANTLGIRSGDFVNVGGTWNSSHLKMGGYRLWVDGSGRLRIKLGAPASDTDGTVVGTQT